MANWFKDIKEKKQRLDEENRKLEEWNKRLEKKELILDKLSILNDILPDDDRQEAIIADLDAIIGRYKDRYQ